MLQTYNDPKRSLLRRRRPRSWPCSLFRNCETRAFYFIVPFIVVLLLGAFVTAIQRPIYQAKGKILVESQEIPTDLVRPTVTETANQRIQVIQQRIMTRDNLLALVKKYGMFARERQWMSGTELLDLMRERTKFELVDINSTSARSGNSTIAFTVSFEYENPRSHLEGDKRFSHSDSQLKMLAAGQTAQQRQPSSSTRESQRLQGELAAIEAQIAENQIRPSDRPANMDPVKLQAAELAKLKEELAQKRAILFRRPSRRNSAKEKDRCDGAADCQDAFCNGGARK